MRALILVLLLVTLSVFGAGPKPPKPPKHCFPLISDTPEFKCHALKDYEYSDFNLIAFGELTAGTGDIQGRALAFEDSRLGNGFSIGDQLRHNDKPYSACFADDLHWGSGALDPAHSHMLVGKNFWGPSYLRSQVHDGSSFFIHLCRFELELYYSEISAKFALLHSNTEVEEKFHGLFVTGDSKHDDLYVINVSAEEFNDASWWSFANVNMKARFIINIFCFFKDITIKGAAPPGLPEHTVYNVVGIHNKVTVETVVAGTLLAPHSDIYQTGGVIEGYTIGKDCHILQVNLPPHCDCVCPPEYF